VGGALLYFFSYNLKIFLGIEDPFPLFFFKSIISLESFLKILWRASISIEYMSFFSFEVLVAVELVLGLVFSFQYSAPRFPFRLNLFSILRDCLKVASRVVFS
jgi:hypothetical protein